MTTENRKRDKMALTDSAYATGIDNTDKLSGLRYDVHLQLLQIYR